MRKLVFTIFALALFLTLIPPITVEAGLGISPASFTNEHLKPGSTYKQDIVISQSDPTIDLNMTIEPDVAGINDWFTFTPGKNFIVPAGQTQFTFTITATIPEDAELTSHTGAIRVKAIPANDAQGGGVSVVKGARLEVKLVTTSTDFADLLVRGIRIEDGMSDADIQMVMRIENRGNIAAAPTKVTLQVLDLNQNPIAQLDSVVIDEVGVGQTTDVTVRLPHTLEGGEYFGMVKVYLNDEVLREEKLTFKLTQVARQIVPLAPNLPLEMGKLGLIFLVALVLGYATYRFLRHYLLQSDQINTLSKTQLVLSLSLSIAMGLAVTVAFVLTLIVVIYKPFADINQPSTEVKGIQTEVPLNSAPPTNNSPTNHEYRIYAQANTTSVVIYIAQEGEQFNVLSQSGEWYKVQLRDGSEGWLRQADVKEKK